MAVKYPSVHLWMSHFEENPVVVKQKEKFEDLYLKKLLEAYL